MSDNPLPIIGRNALVTLADISSIPAKVDTGADSSSLWATDIFEKDGALEFVLFGPGCESYTGKRHRVSDYEKVPITNANGSQVRYVVHLPATINGVAYSRLRLSLADRSGMVYPMLVGRKALSGKFLVDTSKQIDPTIESGLAQEKKARAGKEYTS